MDPLLRRLAVLSAIGALVAPSAAAAQETTERTLSVVGTGEAELTPDRGRFSASVVKRSKSAGTARTRAGRAVRAVISGVLAAGVPRERIATELVSVRRVRRRIGEDGPVRVHYRAASSLTVTVDGIRLLRRAFDAASRRGATEVYGPDLSFTPARRALGQQQAEAEALADARSRAEAAAAIEGQRIVGIRSIDLDPDRDAYFASLDSSSSASGGDSTAIEAGLQTFTSLARVTFLIEPSA